jgi:undecaprenyl-diphosphatase
MTRGRAANGGPRRGDIAWLVIGLVAIVGFIALTALVRANVVIPFDQPLLALIHGWDGNPVIWKVLTETANIPLYVISAGFVIWLFVTKRRREALLVLLIFVAVSGASEGAKQLTLRPRPEAGTAAGLPGVPYSYPSGHVLEALTIMGSVALRIWRSRWPLFVRIAIPTAVSIEVALVGIARIALDAHYPTDVLAGVLVGVGALGLYWWFSRPGSWADHPPLRGADAGDRSP